jgi:hypothetical protein
LEATRCGRMRAKTAELGLALISTLTANLS